MLPADSAPEFIPGARDFRSTHWSLVLAAGGAPTRESTGALEKLCRAYWYPLYAFIRRQGWNQHDSQDLTQAFFAYLLEKNGLARATPEKGRFRSFLLASLTNFLNNERDKRQRLKRGGGVEIVPLEVEVGESRYLAEPATADPPEAVFERQWAQTVIEQTAARLQAEFAAAGHAERFAALKDFLMGDAEALSYADAAAKLDLTLPAVTSAIHRLRTRFREVFREEIAQTLDCGENVDAEIRHLLAALG